MTCGTQIFMNLLVRTPAAGALLGPAGTGGETGNVGQHVSVDDGCDVVPDLLELVDCTKRESCSDVTKSKHFVC